MKRRVLREMALWTSFTTPTVVVMAILVGVSGWVEIVAIAVFSALLILFLSLGVSFNEGRWTSVSPSRDIEGLNQINRRILYTIVIAAMILQTAGFILTFILNVTAYWGIALLAGGGFVEIGSYYWAKHVEHAQRQSR